MPWFRAKRVKRGWLDKYQYDEEDKSDETTIATSIQSTTTKSLLTTFVTDSFRYDTNGSDSSLLEGPNGDTAQTSSSSKFFVIVGAIGAILLAILIALTIVVFLILKKKRMHKRLSAQLDEQERLRQERARNQKKRRRRRRTKKKDVEMDEQKKENAEEGKDDKTALDKSVAQQTGQESKRAKPADIDRMMELLGNRKVEKLMRDPSGDANAADVNRMVKEMMERRMQRAR
ncbi:unnamed protein product, partial [Strongylus vulgaris]